MNGAQLELEVSRELGTGEGTMNNFISQHMVSILQPFADHVQELRKAVSSLSSDMQEVQEKTGKNRAEIEQHSGLLAGLQNDFEQLSSRAGKTETALAHTTQEKDALKVALQAAQSMLGTHDLRIIAMEELGNETEKQLQETSLLTDQVRAGLEATDGKIAQCIVPGMSGFKGDLASLDSKHSDTLKLLGQARRDGEQFNADLQSFKRTYHSQHQMDEKTMGHTAQKLAELGSMLKCTDDKVLTQTDQLKTTIAMVKAFKTKLNHAENDLQQISLQGCGTSDILRDHLDKYKALNEVVEKIMKACGGDEESKKRGNVWVAVDAIDQMVQAHTEDIKDLRAGDASRGDELVVERTRVDDMNGYLAAHQEQISALSDQIGVELAKSAMQVRVEDRLKTWSIMSKMRCTGERVDSHQSDLRRVGEQLGSMTNQLELTKSELQKTKDRLESTNQQVRDVSSGLELTQEYWRGLSNGFRETHKSVTLENCMLPPARGSAAVTMLPVISKTPRSSQKLAH